MIWIDSLALVDAISGIAEKSLKIRLIGSISNDEGDGNENDKKQKLLESDHRQNLPLEHQELKQCMYCSESVLTMKSGIVMTRYIRNGEVYTFLNFGVSHGFCL